MPEQATELPVEGAHATYEVTAIRYGSLRARKSELFHRYSAYGEPDAEVEMAYYFWLLRGNAETVLVDTGFDPAVGERRGRTCLVAPLEALKRLGVGADEVSTVIVTHFHYDHIGNLARFPGAELIVPGEELEFWTGPVAGRTQFAVHVEDSEIDHVRRATAEGRVRLTDGESRVLPGVRAISVGGHSPGQLVIEIDGAGGPVVLASDAVHFYEELELERPFGVIADLRAMYGAYERLRETAARDGAMIVPGHDPLVAAEHALGAGAVGGAGAGAGAVRLDTGERRHG